MIFEIPQTPYSHIWHKYRPAILRLMVDADDAPQHYVFSAHEFKRMFPKNRNSLNFVLNIHRAKALTSIKASPRAQALLAVLNESKTATRLAETATYEIALDEKFVLHVRKNEIAGIEKDVEGTAL